MVAASPGLGLPPGPSISPALQTWRWATQQVRVLETCRERYGRRFTLRFMRDRQYVVLWDPADVRAVFAQPPEAFHTVGATFAPFFGENSLFVIDGDRHRYHRRVLGPPFRGERMRAYGDQIRETTRARIATWRPGHSLRILDETRAIALEVIFRAIFGVDDPALRHELDRALGELLARTSNLLVFFPALQRDLGRFSPWGAYLRRREAFWSLLRGCIDRARVSTAGREDILAKMIDQGAEKSEPFSDEEILHQLVTLLGAGHETTTGALTWTFEFLLSNRDVYERARAEVRSVVGDGTPRSADLEHMPLVEAVIIESLRLMPVTPVMGRHLARDLEIRDLRLPQGTYVLLSSYLTQRDPDLYPDPTRFDPNRFLGRRPPPAEWYPFGGGHRLCIGMAFALFEMKMMLATLLLDTELERAKGPPQVPKRSGITLLPSEGTPVVVRARA